MKMTTALFGILLLFVGALAAQAPSSPEALLKAAQQRELVDGDWRGALAEYKSIISRFPDDVSSAQALMRIGGIHERNGDRSLALESYQQALKHPRANVVAATANARVRALSTRELTLDRRRILKGPNEIGEYVRLSPD